jgi:hypothetical protein
MITSDKLQLLLISCNSKPTKLTTIRSNCTSHTNLIVIPFSIGIVGLLTYVCNGLSSICGQIQLSHNYFGFQLCHLIELFIIIKLNKIGNGTSYGPITNLPSTRFNDFTTF